MLEPTSADYPEESHLSVVCRVSTKPVSLILVPNGAAVRGTRCLGSSGNPGLSWEGRMLLFTDYSSAAGPNYRVCLRRTDGGPIVRSMGRGKP